MKNVKTRILLSAFLLAGLGLLIFQCRPAARAQEQAPKPSQQSDQPQTLQGEAALSQLKQDGHFDSLQAAMRQARYTVQRAENTPLGRAAWHAPNPAHGYDAYVTEDGVSISSGRSPKNKSYVSLTLRGIGYGDGLQYVGGGQVSGDKQTIRIERDGKIKEWYVNGESGLEHGFTLMEPPNGGKFSGYKLRLALALNEGWRAVPSQDGQRVTLVGQEKGEVVEYGKLVVWDAHGSAVTAQLLVEDERVIIEVNDDNAVYPLTIDPTFALQQKVTASDGATSDSFGWSVAISGNTAVIGAPFDDINAANDNQGSAYVFMRAGSVWTQQAKLILPTGVLPATNQGSPQQFGSSVAISGDSIVVGAPGADIPHPVNSSINIDQGIACVFVRSSNTWVWEVNLLLPRTGLAPLGAANDQLGNSVAISGDTVVVGIFGRDNVANSDQGAAAVFVRSGLSWSRQALLQAADGVAFDYFGSGVTVSGDTLAVGAPSVLSGRGAAYVYTRSGTVWSQQGARLLASNGATNDGLGAAIALSGDNLVVGATDADVSGRANAGAAYVYKRVSGVWSQNTILTAPISQAAASFGATVAISNNLLVIGAQFADVGLNENQGEAYVFANNGTNWTLQQTLSPADAGAFDFFGSSVAISGETVLVGASNDAGAVANQGAAYFFTVPGEGPTVEQAKLTAGAPGAGAGNDRFGINVALSNDTAVIGADGRNSFTGAAYVFVRNSSGVWSQQAVLNGAAAGDRFGFSVAINGDWLVVGAPGRDDTAARPDAGAIYIYKRSGASWNLTQTSTKSAPQSGGNYGHSLAMYGSRFVVGSPYDNQSASLTDTGMVVTYVLNSNFWGREPVEIFGGQAGQLFGESVAIYRDTLVIGSPTYDWSNTTVDQGAATVYVRNNTNDGWLPITGFSQPGGSAGDNFGASVAIYEDTILVGAPLDDVPYAFDNITNVNEGSAHVFKLTGAVLSYEAGLYESSLFAVGIGNDYFGVSVALNAEIAAVGAYQHNSDRKGRVFKYRREAANWIKLPTVGASDGQSEDYFGVSVALTDTTLLVGAFQDDIGTNFEQGSAYVYVSCNASLMPTAGFSGAGGQSSSFAVTSTTGCAWTATSQSSWITLTGATSGSGNGTVNYTVAANTGAAPRTGSISVNGSSFSVTQAGSCPSLTVSAGQSNILPGGLVNTPYSRTFTASGGTAPYTFQFINGTTLPPGLSLSSSGVLSGTPTTTGQQFSLQIAAIDANGCVGSGFFYLQIHPFSCGATLPVTSQQVSSLGGTFSFAVNISSDCSWQALDDAIWITPTSSAGFGNGTVTYTVAANTGAERVGTIIVNNLYFTVTQQAAQNGLQFYPLARPIRLLDTRAGQTGCDAPGAMITGGTSRTQTAAGRTCDGLTIPANAKALTGNITTVQSGGGYLTLYPSDAAQPNVANSNYTPNQILNNVFTVGLGAGDGAFKIFVTSNTNVVVDVTGYYAPPAAGGLYFHPLPKPIRLLETRVGQQGCQAINSLLQAGSTRTQLGITTCDGVTIPAGAQALVGNATTVGPQTGGYLTFFPADAAQPLVASSNFLTGDVMNAPFTVGLSPSGEFKIFTTSTTNLVVDVLGYFSTQLNDGNGQGLLFNSLPTPVRLLDTRAGFSGCFTPGAQMTGGTVYTQSAVGACVNIPAAAKAVVGNATVVNVTANGYLTFWPSDVVQPLVATSNFLTGQVFNRHFTVGLGADGAFKRFSNKTTDLVIDLTGYFAP
ncbi:MAG: BACON domain-containing protein [Blastocatellia bacterium]